MTVLFDRMKLIEKSVEKIEESWAKWKFSITSAKYSAVVKLQDKTTQSNSALYGSTFAEFKISRIQRSQVTVSTFFGLLFSTSLVPLHIFQRGFWLWCGLRIKILYRAFKEYLINLIYQLGNLSLFVVTKENIDVCKIIKKFLFHILRDHQKYLQIFRYLQWKLFW